jgi:hypothetical protein
MNSGFLFEMDTSMLGRVAALLNQDLGRSGLGSREDALSMRREKGIKD